VVFKYPNGKTITYSDIDIKKGKLIGIAGRSGSGKSTFIDLITGLVSPSDGFIHIDGIPLSDIQKKSWLASISCASQFVFILSRTVAENIAFGKKIGEIDFDKLRYVIYSVGLEDSINNLPKGYLTPLGDGGVSLSGGEAQRLALARALYKESELVILDEPTSSLDEKTSRDIIHMIKNLKNNSTIVVVSHSRELLDSCDYVYEL
jgi:ABC-type multidrug transport system fused ATPase/permease subunit